MNPTKVENDPCAIRAWAEGRMIYLELTDGRIVGFPADRFKILKAASEVELKKESQPVFQKLSVYAARPLSLPLSASGVIPPTAHTSHL